ncbi:TIGR03085 family metal-binding protein [Couchioplanes azureus]|uniref:TIGR03085 family metal-binding protein n=1 Tax=Couchioplanes caeruleus TaxID=56438 RepID=UPI001670AD4E|nr:TIGR03085 family metal-binding protein [Couchioplanes caeruleus]
MSDYARTERALLAGLLREVGPDAPTLCAGWTTRDLAAHLVVRERRPDAMVGALVPPLAGHTEHVRQAAAARQYADVVHDVRNPPWWSPVSNPLTDELANALEFFIHHEDVRRARPGWEPRTLDRGQQDAIWRAVRFTARLTLRRLRRPVRVQAPGFGEFQVGDGTPVTVLTGAPGELALFLAGRQQVARVEVTGDESIRTARLSM